MGYLQCGEMTGWEGWRVVRERLGVRAERRRREKEVTLKSQPLFRAFRAP
jgi:hypothetical protein